MFKNTVFKVSVDTAKWAKAAAVRAIKTMAQAAIAGIGAAAAMGQVDWKYVASASVLTIIGPPAPPTIAEHSIPANEPWCCDAEFSANENTMEYIMEMLNPTAGKASMDTSLLPNNADNNRMIVRIPEICNNRLLSINLSRIIPTRQPAVINPQK